MLLTAKAFSINVGNPSRKLVLLKLADNANDQGMCFPSYQHIADQCEISRRSAITHINALIEMGLVSKKSRKNQDGSQSNIYYLHLDNGGKNSAQSGENSAPGGCKICTGGSENSAPRTNHSFNHNITTLTSSNSTRAKKQTVFELLAEFGVTDQLANDFVEHRKVRKATITKTALNGFKREAERAGISIQDAIQISIERNWIGFNAGWDWKCEKRNNQAANRLGTGITDADIWDTSWASAEKFAEML